MKYQLDINSRSKNATLIISYSGKLLKSIERKRGVLLDDQWEKLLLFIPQQLSKMQILIEKDYFKNGLSISVINQNHTKSLHQQMVGLFCSFYEEQNEGLRYNFQPKDGKAIKQIISALKVNATSDDEVLATWKVLLDNWEKQELFYRKQQNATQINSNLNTLLRTIKHGKATGQSSSKRHADDLRSRL